MRSDDHGFSAVLAKMGTHPSALVLAALENGALRMSELIASGPKLDEERLGAALRELDADGLVARKVDPGPPLRVLYVLTERGTRLAHALGIVTNWVATEGKS